jgi:hypothetical protein
VVRSDGTAWEEFPRTGHPNFLTGSVRTVV